MSEYNPTQEEAPMKIRCLICKDIIESKHRHDFVWCRCSSVAIDGGREYTKITGSHTDWEYVNEIRESGK